MQSAKPDGRVDASFQKSILAARFPFQKKEKDKVRFMFPVMSVGKIFPLIFWEIFVPFGFLD